MRELWYCVWLVFNFILILECIFIIRLRLDLIKYKVVLVIYGIFKLNVFF